MPDYPVQVSKVQAPPLRDETLARDRLLDWLSVKIHRRAVLLTAEAGYGKTTLLADFTRRTRLRVLWFRLDRGDRDWTGFIAHLVAAVRIHVPDFAPSTRGLLRETATSAPTLETVLDTFLRELVALPAEPTAFVFDDFHLVDDSPDIRHLVRELLTRGPDRMSLVFASRREPPIRLARLRALGEVAELRTDDLRFDASETERLFRETYEMRLEPSLLAELSRRTEGWAASLQLVRAALHDRDPGQVRTFISSLSGAEGHLYEYLAEEVIGELPEELQQFLMRTSVLETVDLTLGPIAADVSLEEATGLIEEGERHGLFGKGASRSRHIVRAHPLVRDFLLARLARVIGSDGVLGVHLRVAIAAGPSDWRVAAQHYIAAGHAGEAGQLLAQSIGLIIGSGAYAAAEELSSSIAGGVAGPAGLVLRSRLAQQRASKQEGLQLAEEAWAAEPTSTYGLLNLVTARSLAGDIAGSLDAGRLLEQSADPEASGIASAFRSMLETSVSGSVETSLVLLESVIQRLRSTGDRHFLGVGLLDRSYLLIAMGRSAEALESADEAIALISETSPGVDLVAARLARANALAMIGRIEEARSEVRLAAAAAAPGQHLELAGEVGQLEGFYGETEFAWPYLGMVESELQAAGDMGELGRFARSVLGLRDGALERARADVAQFHHGQMSTGIAMEARRHLVEGLLLLMEGAPEARSSIRAGAELARIQGAHLWAMYGQTLESLASESADASAFVVRTSEQMPVVLSMLAEPLLARLGHLDGRAQTVVLSEAERRPWRWRASARRLLSSTDAVGRDWAAAVLVLVGEWPDVRLLREASGTLKGGRTARHGYRLARRLAQRVLIEDLGRVRILVGNRAVEGTDLRRKVLGLLCLLLTKPRFALTRDEVVDSLWPEHDPASALNSLNQTAYFLRRVFEPDYQEDTSPGYLGQDAETIWLDSDLVDCRSRRCLEIIKSMPAEPTPEGSVQLAKEYVGRFALDFTYEEWSTNFRDSLHASYLRVMERAVRMDLDAGQFLRGTFLAERAAEIDPDAEEIQVSLIRLYRLSGAHAAAAETYARYQRVMRELGLDPPGIYEL